jgi:hypothetical protein
MAKARETLRFDDRLFLLTGIPALSLLMPFVLPQPESLSAAHFYPIKVVVSIFFVCWYWFILRFGMVRVMRRFPRPQDMWKRMSRMLLLTGLLVLVTGVFCGTYLKDIFAVIYQNDNVEVYPVPVAMISFFVCLAVLGIYESMYAVRGWKQVALEAERLRRENTQAQLDMLRSQVNPHFLFNSLNTLTSLVHDNPDLSVEFIQKLSRTYRYVLEIRDKELIALEEELECLHAYLFMLNIRFGESLVVRINVPDECRQLCLAPLSLQMLIENAIKHNVVSQKRPLHISIACNGEEIEVRNTLQPKAQEAEGTGTGLENIRSRYRLLARREMRVVDGPNDFIVTLPLIRLERYAHRDH